MVEKLLDSFDRLTSFATALRKHADLLAHTNLLHSNRRFSCRRSACGPTQNLLPKPIYFHPAGMKPSRKPAELSQHPEKPLHFTPHPFPTMQPSHCRALIAVLIYFNRVVHPRPDGAKNPSAPDSDTSGSSAFLFHSQQRAAPLPSSGAGAGSKLLQSA